MRSKGFDGMVCSIADVMGAIVDRWGAIIMRDLLLGLTRYEDLRNSTGATNGMLADRLKTLEQNGLVERRQYQARPVRYEYTPTERGYDVNLVLQVMTQIGDKWNLAKRDEPPLRYIDTQTGRTIKVALIDEETGQCVNSGRVVAQPGDGADDLMRWRVTYPAHMQDGDSDRGGRRPVMLPNDIVVARALLNESCMPVRDVAQRMGVSIATIYRHVGKKRSSPIIAEFGES